MAKGTMAIPDATLSVVRLCSYTIRRTQYDRPSQRQLRFLFLMFSQFSQLVDVDLSKFYFQLSLTENVVWRTARCSRQSKSLS